MMFMMPIPPTRSEMAAMATMTISKMRWVLRCSASSSAGTITLKSPALWCETFRMLRTTSAVRKLSAVRASRWR